MEVRKEISRPISITFNGPNYMHWAQAMSDFLKARRVWRIIIGEVVTLVRKEGETEEKFAERKEDWDGKNGDIITWIQNASIIRTNQQFGCFKIAK